MAPHAADSRTDPADIARVRAAVLAWYAVEQRDFPWRGTRDPWAVLVSEVMLQQTQASRVAERFPPFMARFPTAAAMAAATDAQVLGAWSGLGYNRRALALRRAARQVTERGWPGDVAGLEQLPGVGPYTSRAIAALAFGRPVGAVDTNVRRWLVRRFGLPLTAARAELQALADALAHLPGSTVPEPAAAAAWMHASMEFGARVCAQRAPRCESCPAAAGCPARGRAAPVPVPRQAPFAGSDRAARGRILRELSGAPSHRTGVRRLRGVMGEADFERVMDGLERDGLAHRRGASVHLGGAPGRAATIGP
jgi:A/G-specific adenine glycosylase